VLHTVPKRYSFFAVGNLRQNPGMESSLKFVRTVRFVLLASIVFFAVFVEWIHPDPRPTTSTYFYVITGLAVWSVEGMFFFRRRMLKPSEKVLSTQPDDVAALKRWRTAYVGIYALFHSVFMWGLLLRFLRFSLLQVLPFYVFLAN
jgi:hypothetical protein